MIDSKKTVNGYLNQKDWKVRENSNAPFSFGALNKRLAAVVSEDYWLNDVYTPEIVEAYKSGFFHIHDLGGLTLYCCGYSLGQIITKGVRGIPNVPTSKPAKHFASILNQLANLTTIYQNEIMGAVAFSSFDTLLSPFVLREKLDYHTVKQNMQNYIFSVNSNSRAGAEPAFSNVTFDATPPRDLIDRHPIIGGQTMEFTYRECQHAMDMINTAFCEIMLEGDADGKPFAYPIPTYNIHDRFDWDNPNNDLMWEMTGKYGTPYFGNFINSDMDVSDVRSMCCRLRLDLRELRKKTGGLFGADEFTGSIGVVTIGLPRMGYLAKTKEDFFIILRHYMDLAKDSLEIKRSFLEEEMLSRNALPAFMEYVGTLDNHFSTIGLLGMNEMCVNFMGKDITHPDSIAFCQEVLNYMRSVILEYQHETNHLFNLEATPAESACHSLALKDKSYFPGIYTQGSGANVYYTNSCRMPVHMVESVAHAAELASKLQTLFNGGTAEHFYVGRSISGEKAKQIVRSVLSKYPIPYVTISPVNAYCAVHGEQIPAMEGHSVSTKCPICGSEMNLFQRITGYIRNTKYFNNGKAQEFKDRHQIFPNGGE